MRHFVSYLALASATDVRGKGDCDLSGVSGLFVGEVGKYNYGEHYKLKRGRRNPANGEQLVNPGKLLKGRALLKHKNDGEFSDAWVTCKKNKMSSFAVRCYHDGSFTINGASGDAMVLPACEPIGCDPSELPFTGMTDTCRYGYHKGTNLEKNGNKCERTCQTNSGETVTSNRKIKCACDLVARSPTFGDCEYKVFDNDTWKAWNSLKSNGKPIVTSDMCDGEISGSTPAPETDPPTEPPVTEPAVWGPWGDWNACSAGCGEGVQSRLRQCISGVCEGESVETKSCIGPDGAECPQGCKLSVGDFEQDQGKLCTDMFRGPDGFYLPKSGRCGGLSCTDGGSADWKTWVCTCTKKGGCAFKVDGKTLDQTDFGSDFNSLTDCKANMGGRAGGKKLWRWADGRRSAAQPESEVSGGDNWELMNLCYNRFSYGFPEMKEFAGGENDFGLPVTGLTEYSLATTFGRVVERDDGVLVCKYTSPKYDWSQEHETYLQLSVKTGKVMWASSERWWPYYDAYFGERQPGNFWAQQLISQAGDSIVGYNERSIDLYNWPSKLGYNPSVRFICRIEDARDGKWYNGIMTTSEFSWGVPWRECAYSHSCSSSARSEWPVCSAMADDGTVLASKAHNYVYDQEKNSDRLRTEYLVGAEEDGSHWGEWGEFEACPGFCGSNLKREKTRDCLDGDGNVINYKNSMNCFPDTVVKYPEYHYQKPLIQKFTYDSIKERCLEEDVLSKGCPNWGKWADYSECSVTCGSGIETRTRDCKCHLGSTQGSAICSEIDHPLAAEGLCGDDSNGVDSRECFKGACDSNGLAVGDGEGLGCKSDSLFTNSKQNQMYGFTCYDTSADYAEVTWPAYENEYGFVPHNFACWFDGDTCQWQFNLPSQKVQKSNPAICNCDQGTCSWSRNNEEDGRQDCTRGYEWIPMPINDISSHPLADKIVDFNNPQSSEPATVAFTGSYHGTPEWSRPNRRIAKQVPIDNNQLIHTDNHHSTYVLISECEKGSMEWVEGPFDCSAWYIEDYNERKSYGWSCKGEPRLYPIPDTKQLYQWPSSHKANHRVFAICRFKDENDEWVPGELIRFQEYRGNNGDTSRKTKFSCCPAGGTSHAGTQGCADDNLWYVGGNYEARPYQVLYSGKCITSDMTSWSDWSDWGACSKTCENGEITGSRSRTRKCKGGNVGDFGCSDSSITEISEPCGMNLQCNRQTCQLDMNFVDFYRFRLSHVDGVKTSDYWQSNSVYVNRNEDLFGAARDWSGYFPEGTMVASYRCFNPNDNTLGGEEHDATCVCNNGVCDWDREMPICTQHNTSHAGYSWLMPADAEEGAYCVSANYGGVGIVRNGKCHISMAELPAPDTTTLHVPLQYYKDTQQFNAQDGVPAQVMQEMFDGVYASFNEYNGDEAKDESDFYTLSSPCSTAFKWIPADQFSNETSVHLPTTYAYLNFGYSKDYRHETAHLCRAEYAYGKSCYGRFKNGVCGGVDNSYTTVSVLTLDTDNCQAMLGAWSECSGDYGVQCGPGKQNRDGVERACRGTCMTDHFKNYALHTAPNPDPWYVCNQPAYPFPTGHSNPSSRNLHKTRNDGQIFMAPYPLSNSTIDFDTLTMVCEGKGYWDTDYLTGDRYYAPGPGENCQFSCSDPMYQIDGYGYNGAQTKAYCNERGFLTPIDFHFRSADEKEIYCRPNYCAIPSFGKWPVNDNKQQGTRVTMGVECENQVDHGHYVTAAQGAKCNIVCKADNGVAYRADTTISTFWCEDPINVNQIDGYGCESSDKKCLSEWVNAPNPFDLDWEWNNYYTFYWQSDDHNKGVDALHELNENKKTQKCYKVVEETCDATPPINPEEADIADAISWECDNDNQPGSKCRKVCGLGTRPDGQKQTKSCDCTGSCQWKGQVTNCVPAVCQLPEDRYWPAGIVCTSPDGQVQTGPDYPEGTKCQEPCDAEYYRYELWQSDWSTCVCDHDSGNCRFDARKVNSCVAAVCSISTDWMFAEFAEGFDYEGVHVDHFSTDVECDSAIPEGHELAGDVPVGTNCYIKCKEGYEFKDEEVHSSAAFVDRNGVKMYEITCRDTHYHGFEFDVFDSAWDKYGDCGFISNYGFQCDVYPQCGPV